MSKQGQKNPAISTTSDELWALMKFFSLFLFDPSDYILIAKMTFLNEISSYN